MAEQAAPPTRRAARQGLLSKSLTLIGQAIKWLLLSWLCAILIEWIGMNLWWPEEGLAHSRRLRDAEMVYLQADFRRSLITASPAGMGQRLMARTRHVLFGLTRLDDFIARVDTAPITVESTLKANLRRLCGSIAVYVRAAIQVTNVFSLRLVILLLALPLFLMASLVGVVEGLVRRDLRRWGGGRESSLVYHWGKRSVLPSLLVPWVAYLSLPFSLHPSVIVLPFASLFALAVAVTASTFKKYL